MRHRLVDVFARYHKVIWTLVFVALALCVLADRAHWADVAQWREDQSCTIWLGYTQSPRAMPVGLISSVGTPNPNGMPLVATLLSRLPNLLVVSTVLGWVQGVLVAWVCWLIAGTTPLFLLLSLPMLSCIILRATSVEFFNQWVLVDFNLVFFGLWIVYLRRRSAWVLALLSVPMLYAPGIYLAGLANAVVYLLFVLAAVYWFPPRHTLRGWLGPGLCALTVLALALALTWLPYAHAMAGKSLPVPPLTLSTGLARLLRGAKAALEFPHWNLTHWYRHARDSFLQSSSEILTPRANSLLDTSSGLFLVQATTCMIAAVIGVVSWLRRHRPDATFFVPGRQFQGLLCLACISFVLLDHVVSPLLGGPSWVSGERPDQQVQFLPFSLLGWFLLPFVVNLPDVWRPLLRGSSALVAVALTVLSTVGGVEIVDSHLAYRGTFRSPADVPLKHQRDAIAFIAHDWRTIADSRPVPVSYQHGQAWVIEFGKLLEPWYPAPMTVGRAFDFELLRVYRLRNAQEGVPLRSAQSARYIVSYAFKAPPQGRRDTKVTHHVFGRVRVTVIE